MTKTYLKLNTSARIDGSVSRKLVDRTVARIASDGDTVLNRDAGAGLPLLSDDWLAANWTAAEDRSADQKQALALSDALIAELQSADTLVIGLPMYNFGVPAAFKAWVDLVCRNGLTFAYTENGPKGLLEGKSAIVIVTTGGVPLGAPVDHVSDYIKTVLGFIGIQDVKIVAAERLVANSDDVLPKVEAEIDAMAA